MAWTPTWEESTDLPSSFSNIRPSWDDSTDIPFTGYGGLQSAPPKPQAPRLGGWQFADVSQFPGFERPAPARMLEEQVSRQTAEQQGAFEMTPSERRRAINGLRRKYIKYGELFPFLDELEADVELDYDSLEKEFLYAVSQREAEKQQEQQQVKLAEKAAKDEEKRYDKFLKEQQAQEQRVVQQEVKREDDLAKAALKADTDIEKELIKYERAQPTRKARGARAEQATTIGQQAAGLGAEVAIGGAGQVAGAALAPFTAGISYPVLSFAGGFSGSLAAQKIEGRKDISWGRAIRDGLLNLIPGAKPVKAATRAGQVVKTIGRGAAIGAGAGAAGEVIETGIEEQRLPSIEELAAGTAGGAVVGGAFTAFGEAFKSAYGKFAGRTAKELDDAYKAGDPDARLVVDTLRKTSKDAGLEEPTVRPEAITPEPTPEPVRTPEPIVRPEPTQESIAPTPTARDFLTPAREIPAPRPAPEATTAKILDTTYTFRDGEWFREGSTTPVKATRLLARIEEEAGRAIPIREAETIPMGEGAGGRPPVDEEVRVEAPDQVKAQEEVVAPRPTEQRPPELMTPKEYINTSLRRLMIDPSETGTLAERDRASAIGNAEEAHAGILSDMAIQRKPLNAESVEAYFDVSGGIAKIPIPFSKEPDIIYVRKGDRYVFGGELPTTGKPAEAPVQALEPAPKPTGGGVAPKPPELMTPDEFAKDTISEGVKGRLASRVTRKDAARMHKTYSQEAVEASRPISAAAVDAYKITLPDGYVREGDRYVFRGVSPESPAGVRPEAPPMETLPPAGEEAPSYIKAREPLLTRATELGISTKGTNEELQTRIAKREKVMSFIDDVEAGAKQRLSEIQKTTTLGANKPLGMAVEYTIIGASKMARGTVKFADWSREMVSEFGEAIRPYLRQIYQRAITINKRDFDTPEDFTAFSTKMAEGLKMKTKDVEAAKPVEAPVVGESPMRQTGLRNEVGEAERKAFDLDPVPEKVRKAEEIEWKASEKKFEDDPTIGKRLVQRLKDDPTLALNDADTMVLLRQKVKVSNEVDAAQRALNAAKTPDEVADAKARFDSAMAEYEDILDAANTAGTVQGRAFAMRKAVAAEDYSLARMTAKAISANEGKPLTDAQRASIEEQSAKIQELQEKITNLESSKVDGQITKLRAEENVKKSKGKPTFEEEPSVNPENMGKSVKDLARYFVGKGVTDRTELIGKIHEVVSKVDPEVTIRDVRDAFSDYGKFRPLSKDEIDVKLRDLRTQLQQISKLEDMEAGKAPSKTGMERQAPSDEARRLIQQVNEAKKRGGYDITDPEKQLASALQTVKKRLTNQIADLEYQIKSGEKIVKQRGTSPTDAEADALRARRDELKKEYDAIFGTRELTDEQRVRQAMAAINRSIEDISRRIREGDLFPAKKVSKTPETPEIAAARAEREALREQLKELQLIARPKKTPEEISLQAYKTRVKNQIAELQRKRAAGDFTTKPKKEQVMDPEAMELYYQLDKEKRKYNEALVETRLKNRSVARKIFGGIGEGLNFARAVMTSLDLSAPLRQGGMIALARPVRAAKALPQMLRAAVSEKQAFAAIEEIRRRPTYKDMKAARLEITEPTSSLTSVEEQFQSRLVEKFPTVLGSVIRGSQRAYTTFLNRLRADSFDAMTKSLSRDGVASKEEKEQIAKFINVATGRGDLKQKYAAAARGLNTVFFAPRYAISRFQAVLGTPMWGGNAKTRKLIAQEYARYLGGIGAIYGLVSARNEMAGEDDQWDIEFDPRSSDFGKIKIGDTRLDMLSGLSQATVFLSRVATGETKTIKGDIKVVREGDRPLNYFREDDDPLKTKERGFKDATMWGVAGRFLGTKLSPAFGTGWSRISGRSLFQEDEEEYFGNRQALEQLFMPLTIRDIYDALREQDVPEGIAMTLLAIFGVGVQTYKPKETKVREKSPASVSFGGGKFGEGFETDLDKGLQPSRSR